MARTALMRNGVAVAKAGLAVGRAEGGSSACCCGGGGQCTGLPPCVCSPSGVPNVDCANQQSQCGELVRVNGVVVSDTRVSCACCVAIPHAAGVSTGRVLVAGHGGMIVPSDDPENPLPCPFVWRRESTGSGTFDPFQSAPYANGVVVTYHDFQLNPNDCAVFESTTTSRYGGVRCTPNGPLLEMPQGCSPFPNQVASYGRQTWAKGSYEETYFERLITPPPGQCVRFLHNLIRTDYDPPCPNPTGRGACCCNGVCVDCWTQAECAAAHGTWKGIGSKCFDVPCRPSGRCCIPGFGCADMPEVDCVAVGGSWTAGACVQTGEPCTPEDPTIPGVTVGRARLMFVPLIGGRF